MKKFIFALLLLIGCTEPSEAVNKVSYYKDNRTGLCFVRNPTYYHYEVFTNVPCTPEVERLLEK